MIAVALGLLSFVVMIATGVAASSTTGDRLAFLGVGVQTTTAQVFITGAIFGWVFVIALWLLRVGMHRSGERCAELAARRSRRAGEWLGFGEGEAEDDGWDGWDSWDGWDEWGRIGRRPSRSAQKRPALKRPSQNRAGRNGAGRNGAAQNRAELKARGGQARAGRFRAAASLDTDRALADGRSTEQSPSGAVGPDGIVDGTGSARHGRGSPWRPDRRFDGAHRPGAGAADQPGPLGGGHPPGPVAGRLPGLGVDGGAQGRQIGGGPGAVPGEDRGADGEHRPGESRQ